MSRKDVEGMNEQVKCRGPRILLVTYNILVSADKHCIVGQGVDFERKDADCDWISSICAYR
ncbi:hypothetical protein SERLADRAFT_377353 [Serpula lacrymans var. lacrymans S7.9]|uniref:Uncharacterized protein n=1 Tax=Serpula lacrymans var. lacrymans (strain S7.9) TaxID=578457 RepID=F8NIW1_SERL9|nr:uncharacterized protein SERLADRAFT_377353 [Serpula lacrymans var. lacrymans S7.9]EGO28994.1 hypothetical protein SERLADRAFT_377353 [Serpula lacrymans var. lacrymans S7.9]